MFASGMSGAELRSMLLAATAGPRVARRVRTVTFSGGETFEVSRNDRGVSVSVRVTGFDPGGLSFLFSNGATPIEVFDNVGLNLFQVFTLLPGDQLFATAAPGSSGSIQISEAFFS